MAYLAYVTSALALVFFLLGAAILVRASRAAGGDRARYVRAAAGAMAVGAGNALLALKSPTMGFLLILAGVMLIWRSGR